MTIRLERSRFYPVERERAFVYITDPRELARVLARSGGGRGPAGGRAGGNPATRCGSGCGCSDGPTDLVMTLQDLEPRRG